MTHHDMTADIASGRSTHIDADELTDLDLDTSNVPAAIEPANSETVSDFNIAAVTDRVHKLIDGMLASRVEIGREFIAVKAKLEHGEFGKWIAAEFDMTDRTAQNFMNAATAVQEHQVLAVLPDKALYLLGAKGTPSDVIEKAVTKIKAGNVPTTREIEAEIQTARWKAAEERAEAARAAKKIKGMTAEDAAKVKAKEEKKAAVQKKKDDAQRAEWKRRQEEGEKSGNDAIAFLVEHLGSRFREFAELYEKAGSVDFLQAMRRAVKSGGVPSNVIALNAKKDAA
ncbi:DUF3102 domain-containing protein [Mesorhizobium sp. B2-2-4]|uniref:DUF3102 domain-containing protein n=1 Tax=unclassified Mesorhizobium TaxID=325217 RepID=UPI0011283340|nr:MULTISPECIES: DUF3102 domain-containing protein [unclassified Mesorhizobium]TPM61110.1 DUF3102 domain-containing protein [Mesorhizobium sp. B2-2-4]TPM70541.1 DUF3102 domain-containing protein [Mesorhizobium sp. B2-2-1]TPN70394.1 DUF3102 domain-containing protein [Mesorhizobium sp. B1-1-3]